jgi:hypothetical protein
MLRVNWGDGGPVRGGVEEPVGAVRQEVFSVSLKVLQRELSGFRVLRPVPQSTRERFIIRPAPREQTSRGDNRGGQTMSALNFMKRRQLSHTLKRGSSRALNESLYPAHGSVFAPDIAQSVASGYEQPPAETRSLRQRLPLWLADFERHTVRAEA